MSVEKIKTEALSLNPEERAYLARELLSSLDALSEAEIEKLWIEEAMRREEALDKGLARSFPAEEVLTRARKNRK